MARLGCKINEENQFIDFRLITQRGKNHAFIPLCHQPQLNTVKTYSAFSFFYSTLFYLEVYSI